jgi:hypothetical protein
MIPRKDFSQVQFGYMQLKELTDKEPSDILMTFIAQRHKFKNTIEKPLKSDIYVLFVHCLSKICNAQFDQSKLDILMTVCRSPFVDNLQKYILDLPYVRITERRENCQYWNNTDEFWIHMMKFYDTVMDLSPNTAYECFRKLLDVTKLVLEGLQEHQKERFPEDFLNTFDSIQYKMDIIIEDISNKLVCDYVHNSIEMCFRILQCFRKRKWKIEKASTRKRRSRMTLKRSVSSPALKN